MVAAVGFAAADSPAGAAEGDGGSGAEPRAFGQIGSMLDDLREIMGFGPKGPVRYSAISKSKFQALYRRRMRQQQSPRAIRGEILFLKMFGFVPEGFDYEKTVLDLMSEQAWALYDFKRKSLYLADWAPPDAQEFAVLHELVHAIDDQHFNLLRYIDGAKQAERQLARLAAVEGQASWVMTEWAMRQSRKSLVGNRLLAITTASATRFEAEQFPVYRDTPLYFREVLIFPYTDGLLFQHDMIERFGMEGLKRVFRQPPQNTQQIMQPDLYLGRIDPQGPDLPAARPPRGFRRIYEGSFGQLDHRILLEQHLGEGSRGALLDKWRGSRFEIRERRRDGASLLRYAVRWADAETAREYYHLYRQVCERKWPGLELVDRGPGRCEGAGPAGRVMLELNADEVRSVEGIPATGNGGT